MKVITKVTEGTAVVKVGGTAFTETISLKNDLTASTQVLPSGAGSYKVGIQFLQWSCPNDTSKITITRNGIVVIEMFGQSSIDLSGNGGFNDLQENASDLVVTGTGWLYIALRKYSGYVTKVEPWRYGQYDNTTVAGA